MLLQELREQVLETAQRMLADGVAHGSQGNVSARDPRSGAVAITPTAIPYDKLTPEDICVIDLERQQVDGRWRPTSEIALHMVFYRRRPDVLAVVHSHAPYTTVFGIINEPLPMVLTEAATCLTGTVPLAPYRRPGSLELAEVTFNTMAPYGAAAIMAHHGLVTVGATLGQAYDATLAAETTARLLIMARSMGANPILLSPDECAAMREIYLKNYKPQTSRLD